MITLTLSRVRLRAARGEVLSAIAPLLVPDDESKRAGHAHRVLWLLFQDIADAKRDFLWRDEGDGRYLVLSPRPPSDPLGLFEIDSKPFEPSLSSGDRLRFSLRANPTIATKAEGGKGKPDAKGRLRGQRVDVVMHALKPVPETDVEARTGRAFERDQLVITATADWLTRQGESHGFTLPSRDTFSATGYTQVGVERRKRRPAGISVVDLSGEIEVTAPAAFLAKLPLGFGSAKAFGCGLMLIRRA